MEVKIGIQNIGRELVLESAQDADAVAKVVELAVRRLEVGARERSERSHVFP